MFGRPKNPPQPARVDDDVRCARCNYVLTGLPHAGLCPECALPVRFSRAIGVGDVDPSWVARIILGVSLLLAATFSAVALGLLNQAFRMTAGTGLIWLPPDFGLLVGTSLATATGAVGVFALTTRAEFPARSHFFGALAVVLRIGAAVLVLLSMVSLTLYHADMNGGNLLRISSSPNLAEILAVAGGITFAVVLLGLLFYLRWIAAQLRDVGLKRGFALLIWSVPMLPALVVAVAAAHDDRIIHGLTLVVLWLLTIAVGLAGLLVIPYFVYLLWTLRATLLDRRQIWATTAQA